MHTDLSFISNAHGKEQIIVEKTVVCGKEKYQKYCIECLVKIVYRLYI
jgi:hypothetical protein